MTPSRRVMVALDEAGIANCHWKSNEHLDAALDGLTDLDLLVDPSRRDEALAVIADAGFAAFPASWSRRYPGLEDHLAVDADTGRIHHLHLHFALDAGEPHLKSYRLPWEGEVLTSRRLDDRFGVHVTDPALEVVLLVTRATMKLGVRRRLRRRGLSSDDRRELDWLLDRTTPAAIETSSRDRLGAASVPLVRAVVDERSHDALVRLRRHVRRVLADHRRHAAVVAPVLGLVRTATWAGTGVARRWLDLPVPFARQAPSGGVVVAIVGSDGAGKSTLHDTLLRTLRTDVDTMAAYLGSGDGAVGWLRRPLVVLRARRRGDAPDGAGVTVDDTGARVREPTLALAVWALLIAREKRRALRRCRAGRRRGLVVVADRWPQTQIPGHNDGPLLDAWRTAAGWRGAVARWERAPYEDAERHGPDLVLRLVVSPATAAARRPGHDPDDLRRRIDIVAGLRFPEGTVVDLDADAPADAVTAAALAAVWGAL